MLKETMNQIEQAEASADERIANARLAAKDIIAKAKAEAIIIADASNKDMKDTSSRSILKAKEQEDALVAQSLNEAHKEVEKMKATANAKEKEILATLKQILIS